MLVAALTVSMFQCLSSLRATSTPCLLQGNPGGSSRCSTLMCPSFSSFVCACSGRIEHQSAMERDGLGSSGGIRAEWSMSCGRVLGVLLHSTRKTQCARSRTAPGRLCNKQDLPLRPRVVLPCCMYMLLRWTPSVDPLPPTSAAVAAGTSHALPFPRCRQQCNESSHSKVSQVDQCMLCGSSTRQNDRTGSCCSASNLIMLIRASGLQSMLTRQDASPQAGRNSRPGRAVAWRQAALQRTCAPERRSRAKRLCTSWQTAAPARFPRFPDLAYCDLGM